MSGRIGGWDAKCSAKGGGLCSRTFPLAVVSNSRAVVRRRHAPSMRTHSAQSHSAQSHSAAKQYILYHAPPRLSPAPASAMSPPVDPNVPRSESPDAPEEQAHFRQTLVRVMSVQIAALLFLGWLQLRYAN